LQKVSDLYVFSNHETHHLQKSSSMETISRQKPSDFTGGMPKANDVYRQAYENNISKAILKTRSTQQALIESYFKDFAKHSGKINAMHIASVLEDVPLQIEW